jgi:hypothetical protein
MTSKQTATTDWSNTWWGKLLMGALAVLIGMFVMRLASGYENLRLIPELTAKIEAQEKRLKALEDKQTYGEMLVQARREAEIERAKRSERFDDSLIKNDRVFHGELLKKMGR